MKVIIDAQEAIGRDDYCTATNGVAQFELNIIKKLLERGRFDYRLAFFDHNGDNGNKKNAEKRFGTDTPLIECREVPYPHIRSDSSKTFDNYFSEKADVYWLPYLLHSPPRLNDNTVVTVHDFSRLYATFYDDKYLTDRIVDGIRNSLNALRSSNALIATDSHRSKREILAQGIDDNDRINVVYISCNEAKMYPDDNKSVLKNFGIDSKYILSIGRFEGKKNQANILRAFDVIANKYKNIKLVFVGRSEVSKGREFAHSMIMNIIESSPYRDRILITDTCDEDEKRILLSNAQALIFPSIHEGFGLPILEAMRCGCPVITSNTTACPEIASDAGLLVAPSDALEIADAMDKVLSDDDLRAQMRAKGFEQAKKFSWDKAAEQMENLFVKASLMRGQL